MLRTSWLRTASSRLRLTPRRPAPGRGKRPPLRLEALEGRELLAPIITTFAGKREAGFGGDGGPAALAQLDEPSGVTVDANGNVFTVDDFNERIRKVTPAG